MTDIEQEARAYAERHAVATENVETAVQRVVAAYIAGASRPTSPATKEAVEALHQPKKVWESDRSYTLVCRECTLRAWPCPTYQAITKKGDNREDSRIS